MTLVFFVPRLTLFLSTPSARRATSSRDFLYSSMSISIHALREEGDHCHRRHQPERCPISIHALREEGDLRPPRKAYCLRDFYPRPPRGGRRGQAVHQALHQVISIHALREEGDILLPHQQRRAGDISIHALREEGDAHDVVFVGERNFISIHALREEGDIPAARVALDALDFYPRPPRGGRQQKQRQNLYFQTNYTTFCTNLEEP